MNEEKRQVLDLLQAGKITQDQAQRLLEALGEDPAPEPPVSGDFTPAAPGLPPRLAELRATAQSKLEEAQAKVQAKLDKAQAKLDRARDKFERAKAALSAAAPSGDLEAALAEAQAQMDEVQGEWEAAQAEFAAYQIRTDDIEKAQNELHLEEEPAGPSEDEVGPQEDEVGPQEDEVGPKEDEVGPQEDGVGPDGGETGPNPGDFGSNPGQNGSIPGDFALYNSHFSAPAAPLTPLPLEPHVYELPTPGPISHLQVNWVNGPVEVRPWEGDTLRLTEYSPRPLKEEERLALREENGQLIVQWTAKPAVSLGFRPFSLQKHLVVDLPQAACLEEIKVESVSGALYLSGFPAGKIKAQAVSGSVSCQGLWAEQLWAESASGAVRLASVSSRELEARSVSGRTELLGFSCATLKGETVSGALTATGSGEEIKLSTVSGALSLQAEQYPCTARLNTVSGKISLGLPQEGPGFTVEYDSVSGGFRSRFPLIGDITKRHGQAAFGQGGAALHLETVSGAMELYPLP